MQAYREVENKQLAFVILDSTSLLLKMLIFYGQLCEIPPEKVRRVFYIDDYSVKKRKGPQYDVLYEDSGLDEVHTFDPSTLLSMLEGGQAELVTDALPKSWYLNISSIIVFRPSLSIM